MERQFLIRHPGYTRSRLYAAVIVGETKSQWKAHKLDSDGNDTGKEIRVNKRTGKEVGSRTHWRLLSDPTNLAEMLAADRARREEEKAKRDEQQAQWERKVSNIKSMVKLTGWVSEELGLAKAECITPRSGLVVMVYTAEDRSELYGAPGVTVRITGYYRDPGMGGGSTTSTGPDVETALASYLATWHWD